MACHSPTYILYTFTQLFICFSSLGSSSCNKDTLSVLLFTQGTMLEWFLFHICASRGKRRAASDCWDDRGVLFIPSHFYRGKISAFNLVGKWTLPLTFWLHPHLRSVVWLWCPWNETFCADLFIYPTQMSPKSTVKDSICIDSPNQLCQQ